MPTLLASGRRAVKEACTLASKVHVCTTFMGALAAVNHIAATVIPLTSVTSQAATIKWPPQRRESDTFRIVQVASLSRVKNQRLLIDTLPIVRETVDAHVDLVGEDTLNGALQNHAAKLGGGEHVTFHGFLPLERVLELLSRADLYVQTSIHEAAGVAVLEAAAAGVPTPACRSRSMAALARTFAIAQDATWSATQFDSLYRSLR